LQEKVQEEYEESEEKEELVQQQMRRPTHGNDGFQ